MLCWQAVLQDAHQAAARDAFEKLHRESFGEVASLLDSKLQKALDKELQDTMNRNELVSTRVCSALESEVRPPPALLPPTEFGRRSWA